MAARRPLVLNVNDDEARRYLLARILTAGEFDVVEAETGEEAIARATSVQPDLVLLDVKLPDVDGFEVCRRLKADPATAPIPVVMLSAILVETTYRVHGLESGADGYLTEPLQPTMVIATLRALLRARAAEEARRESEAQYRTLFELNPLPCYVVDDATHRIVAVNRAAVDHYGYTEREFLSLSSRDLFVAGPPPGEAETGLWRHRRRDGSVFDVDLASARMQYGGRNTRLVVFRDVTDRRRAEARIATQLAVTRVLAQATTMEDAAPRVLAAIGQGLGWEVGECWQRDRSTERLTLTAFWSSPDVSVANLEAAGRLLAVGRGEGFLGRVWETRAPVWSADLGSDPLFFRACEHGVLRGGFGFPIMHGDEITAVMLFMSRDIRRADPELLRAIFGIGGMVGEFMERCRAEQALRDAETRYRLVARATNDVIWDFDVATQCRMVSEGIARFGYRPEDVQGVARWGNARLHPEDRERVERGFDAALASEGTFWSDEYRLRRADGTYAVVSDRAYIIRDATGRAVRVVGATTDMTERHLAEERRRLRALSVGTLQAREEEARRIARELHDEAGQLLASVHIAIDRLAADTKELDPHRVNEIKGLLDLTEAELRRIAHELRPTVLDDLGLGPALSVLAENVSSRSGASVVVDAPLEDRLPPTTETAIYRIVQEATGNAVKHGSASRVDVRVGERAGAVECTVTDNGVGFDVDQASAPGARGLGLIGIRERLEPLGGTFEIVSRPGAGTQLTVTIPREAYGTAHPAR